MQKLLECATHTLLRLEMAGDVHDPKLALAGFHFIGSLKPFQVLKTIRVGASMFIEPLETEQDSRNLSTVHKPGRPRRLIDMLPASTIEISFASERVISGRGVDEDVAIAMLEGLADGKTEFLPNLNRVEFEFDSSQDIMLESRLWRDCRRVGVEITGRNDVLN